jgi:hypothetical protein
VYSRRDGDLDSGLERWEVQLRAIWLGIGRAGSRRRLRQGRIGLEGVTAVDGAPDQVPRQIRGPAQVLGLRRDTRALGLVPHLDDDELDNINFKDGDEVITYQ